MRTYGEDCFARVVALSVLDFNLHRLRLLRRRALSWALDELPPDGEAVGPADGRGEPASPDCAFAGLAPWKATMVTPVSPRDTPTNIQARPFLRSHPKEGDVCPHLPSLLPRISPSERHPGETASLHQPVDVLKSSFVCITQRPI